MVQPGKDRPRHELELLQNELKLQKEKLLQTQAQLEELRNRFADLYDFAPVGYLTLDKDNIIVEANFTICQMLGLPLSKLLQQNLAKFMARESQDAFHLHARQVRQEQNRKISELRMQKADASFFTGELSSIRTKDDILQIAIVDISEQRQAEEALKESEAKANALIKYAPTAIYELDYRGPRFISVNDAMCRLSGYTREELLTISPNALLEENSRKLFAERIVRQLAGETIDEIVDYKVKKKDGTLIDVTLNIAFSRREPHIAFVIGHDVTERKRAEEALRESQQKYQALVDNAYEVIVVAQDGIVKFMNKKGLELTGYSLDEIVGKPFLEVVHPDDQKLVAERYRRRIRGEAVETNLELRVIPKDGITRWANSNSVRILWGGKPAVLAVFMDVTNQKKAEEALKESEEKYREVVENASEAISVTQDDKLKLFNHQVSILTGYSEEELKSISVHEFTHPDDRDLVRERYQKRLQGEIVPSSYEFRILRKDGGTRWININAVLITWEGRPASLGLFTDITDHRNLEQELKDYAQKITRVQEEERKRIAYELHDDTAQYLALLKLEIDSLLHSGKITDPEVTEKLQHLEKDAERAINDVRRYSHELRPGVLEHLGLVAALEQVADDINKLQKVTVQVAVEGEEREMPEDIKLGFFRIAQEALNNTRKHSKASQANITLTFRENQVEMTISDNGIGFDVKEAATRAGGKGSLGLMSMRERANLIGAELIIESKPGQGTTVRVVLSI